MRLMLPISPFRENGVSSSGETVLKEVGFVTPAATFEGLSGTVKLASLLPPRTRGPQTLKLRMLEAGLPLGNGVVTFDMDRDGLRILDARWPFASGQVVLASRGADVLAPDARFDLTVEHVDLEALLKIVEVPGLTATGRIGGTIPVVLRDGDPVLLDGALSAEDKGIIVYLGAGSDIAPGEETKLLTDALRNFHYTELTGGLAGNANGDLVLRLGLRGSNPDLYEGYPFAINVKPRGIACGRDPAWYRRVPANGTHQESVRSGGQSPSRQDGTMNLPQATTVRRRAMPSPKSLMLVAGLVLVAAGCNPTVKIEAPDKPIEINLNVKIEQEIRIKVDRDLDQLLVDNPDLF